MGFRMHRDVVGESYSSVASGENDEYRPSVLYRPYPELSGKLKAGYCFGKKYAPFAPEAIGRKLAERYDWSGSGQHIGRWGRWIAEDYWLTCNVSSVMPRTPFTADTLIADPDQGITIVAFCYSDATAKAVWLARSLGAPNGSNTDFSSTVDPYVTLLLQPQTSSGRVVAGASVSNDLVQGTLNPLPDELGEVAMYAATHTSSSRCPFARGPGVSLKTGTPENSTRLLSSAGYFIMGAETGSGGGFNRLLGEAFYEGVLDSDDLNEIHTRYALFHSAIASGLTIT